MKITEGCSCTANITVEDADPTVARAAHAEWVARHQCDHAHPWHADKRSTTAGYFGFSPQRTVWDPFKATAQETP